MEFELEKKAPNGLLLEKCRIQIDGRTTLRCEVWKRGEYGWNEEEERYASTKDAEKAADGDGTWET